MKTIMSIWAYPAGAWYLLIFVILLGIVIIKARRTAALVLLLAAPERRSLMIPGYSLLRSMLKNVLLALGLLSLFLTLLHPSWNTKEEVITQQGRDLFIALDISRSMLAQDLKPNRLSCAKEKIKKLVHALSAERVGLILFAGAPIVQCPLTSDYGAFFMFLDAVDGQTVSQSTTAFDQLLYKVLHLFERMPTKKHKLLVMVTDGEDFSTSLAEVKNKAKKAELHIFTLGVGTTQGAPIPLFDALGGAQGVERDSAGEVVISRLDEAGLRALAHDSGGSYVASTDNDHDVRVIASYVERYEKEYLEQKKVAHAQEQYPYFLAVSFICFLLEWLL